MSLRIVDQGGARHAGRDLFQRSQPLSSDRRFEQINPVMLLCGRARLATKPLPTGFEPPTNTIGMVGVACCSALIAGVLSAKATSGVMLTSSPAYARGG